ncbi:PIG-L family deacetylase [Paenibacillus pasadenensis]|uniref:PIG-L family deacetylase n=1 Tax=Paenibacillus pasadenensis TaxID=217090 RepID=UPI00203B21A9|nr:PIG-L family deacetylase [Paenibacillus pasadenensis]MCM3750304.1 PIG-L family deacetylase [Paenibacillus pasadenensis]
MKNPVALLFAHPDDETFLAAALSRKLADEGHPPVLLVATRGDAGMRGSEQAKLLGSGLGAARERELADAARILGIGAVGQLGYPDGKLEEADEKEAVRRAAEFLRTYKPSALVTFPPDGGNGHPDHKAISRIGTRLVKEGHISGLNQLYYVASPALEEQGRTAELTLDSAEQWTAKAAALAAHTSQSDTIARYFGDLSAPPKDWRYERFYLAWEDGQERF